MMQPQDHERLIAIKCDVKFDVIMQTLTADVSWAPWSMSKTYVFPLSSILAVWMNEGVVVVNMGEWQVEDLRSVRAETLPEREPDVVEDEVWVCPKGHPVSPISDDYYECYGCNIIVEGFPERRKMIIHKPTGNYRNAEVGPPVIGEWLCCTKNNIEYFFKQLTGLENYKTGSSGISYTYSVPTFFKEEEMRKVGTAVLRRGIAAIRYSDYDSPIALTDIGRYVELNCDGVSVYTKTGDLTVQEIRDLIREFTMKDITFALACMNTDNISKEVVLEAVNESLKDKPATDRLLVIYRLVGEEINMKQAEMLLHDALKELENKFDPMDATNMRIIAEDLGFIEMAGMFKALAEKAREEERKREEKEKEILEKEAKEKVEGIRKEFSNLPVLIDYKLVGREVKVKVRLRKALEKEAFEKYVETCKRLGMSFDSKSKTWGVYIKLA
jgi:hypothetical protein